MVFLHAPVAPVVFCDIMKKAADNVFRLSLLVGMRRLERPTPTSRT